MFEIILFYFIKLICIVSFLASAGWARALHFSAPGEVLPRRAKVSSVRKSNSPPTRAKTLFRRGKLVLAHRVIVRLLEMLLQTVLPGALLGPSQPNLTIKTCRVQGG